MSVIGAAEVAIRPDTSSFADDLKSKIGDALKNPAVIAGAAVAAVGATVTAFAKSSVDKFQEVGGQVKQLTTLTGGSAESMSRLRFAADTVGVSTNSLGAGLRKLSIDISTNSSKLKDAGVAFTDAKGKALPLDQTLANVAQKFATMPNGVAKNTLAIQLFGKSGTDLIPILNKGKDGLAELSAESDKYGLTLTGKNLDSIKQNAIAHKQLQDALEGVKVQVGAALMPALAQFATFVDSKVIPVITQITALIHDRFGPDVKDAMSKAEQGITAFIAAFKAGDGDITSSGLNGYLEGLGNTARTIFNDAKEAYDAFAIGFTTNGGVTDQLSTLTTAFAALGVAVRDGLGVLKDVAQFFIDHPKIFEAATASVLGFKAAYEGIQFGQKTINFVANGLDAAKGAINDIVSGFAKIGDKVISIAVKSTAEQAAGGAASGAGNAVGDQAGNVVSGAAGGALGNFFDLKKLLPKIKLFAAGFAGALIAALGSAIETAAIGLLYLGEAIAAIVFSPEFLIAAVVAAVAFIGIYFRKGLVDFFANTLPAIVRDAVGGAGDFLGFLEEKGKDFLQGLLDGVIVGLDAVGKFFNNLPNYILYAIGYLGGTLFRAGVDLLIGLWAGIKFAWEAGTWFFVTLPEVIANYFADAIIWLAKAGWAILQGLWDGIQLAWAAGTWFFVTMPDMVATYFADAYVWIKSNGGDILRGMWAGVQDAWHAGYSFFTNLPGNIQSFFADAPSWIKEKGSEVLRGFSQGAKDAWHDVQNWYNGVRASVIGAIPDAKSWLIEAGKDVIRGLLNGIGQLYDSVVGKMKSLGGSIVQGFKDGAGIKSPSTLMHASGVNIVQGLLNGIDALAPQAVEAMRNLVTVPDLAIGVNSLPGGARNPGKYTHIEQLTIQNTKTLQENLDEIDRLYPSVA